MSPSLPAIRTRVGHADWGDNAFCGFSVATELAGEETIAGLIAMAAAGRRLSPDERAVLDDVAVAMTVADARIWPLKMTRLLSSYGSCLPAFAAAILCIEDASIGHWTSGEAAALLSQLRDEATELTVEAMRGPIEKRLKAGVRLIGFGVPFRPFDERVRTLKACLARSGREQLPHWRALEAAAGAARELRGLDANIGLAVAATCLDLGFTPPQIAVLSIALGMTDYLANAVEGAEQRLAILRRLPDDRVEYVGKAERASPRMK